MNDEIKEAVRNRLEFANVLLNMDVKKETPEQIAYNTGFERSLSYEIKFLEKLLEHN